ncbi:MAG: T9SS type A sorting domain-containing protein [bacterium]|nr:T9SS type A sorting domain-containing protein [bacterium]
MNSRRLFIPIFIVVLFGCAAFAQTFTTTHPMLFSTGPLGPSSTGFAMINVPEVDVVTSIKIRANITFPIVDDLELRLVSPSNTQRIIASAVGLGANFTNTVFWDGAAQPINGGVAPFTGFFQPMLSLNVFNGEPVNGMWMLQVQNFGGQSGSIDNFELELNAELLPVELNSFSAEASNNQVHINWRTESETNNARFNLYRSTNSDQRGDIVAEIAGHGTSANQHTYSFIDNRVVNGMTYYYRLSDVDVNGIEYIHASVVSATPMQRNYTSVPGKYSLNQNYPNPFNPSTAIAFKLAIGGHVTLTVFDILGNEVSRIVDESLPAGEHSISFNAVELPSGIYFYRLSTQGFSTTKRMVLMK